VALTLTRYLHQVASKIKPVTSILNNTTTTYTTLVPSTSSHPPHNANLPSLHLLSSPIYQSLAQTPSPHNAPKMLIRLLTPLLLSALLVTADVKFTGPAAGDTITGGGVLSVKWRDSGESPAITDLLSYQLFLCAGGNTDTSFIQLAPIVTTGQFSTGNAASGVVQAGLGGSTRNA
jgi:hypothetical protein